MPKPVAVFVGLYASSLLGWMLAAGLVDGPRGPDPSGTGEKTAAASISFDRNARRYVESIRRGQARGAVYGVKAGGIRELSPADADAMRRASAIRDRLRALHTACLSAQDLKKAGAPAQAEEQLARARAAGLEALKTHPPDEIRREVEAFRPFLGSDPEATALFNDLIPSPSMGPPAAPKAEVRLAAQAGEGQGVGEK